MPSIDDRPNQLRMLVETNGFTVTDAARSLGISRSTATRWLKAERTPRAIATVSASPTMTSGKASLATRASLTSDVASLMTFTARPVTAPRYDPTRDIATMNKAGLAFDGLTGDQFLDIAIRSSPEISRAVWDYLRLLNSGIEIDAFEPGTDQGTESELAQAALKTFLSSVADYYDGSFDVFLSRLFKHAIVRGAFFAELVLDDTGLRPIGLLAPDPRIVVFRTKDDPDFGKVWEIGRKDPRTQEFISLDRPSIRYVPIEQEMGSPYAASMLAPAIFPAMFLMGLMYDLRRVVAQQGYPRGDVEIDLEKLAAVFQSGVYGEAETTFDDVLRTQFRAVADAMADLQPDDSYIHTSATKYSTNDGAIDASVMKGASDMIGAAERMLTRGLKMMPLLMGIPDDASEANANRQWEVFAQYIKQIQHYCENMLESLLGLALEVQGIQCELRVRFAENRYAEQFRDSQTDTIRLGNAKLMEDLGYTTRDEASIYAVGHPAAMETAPNPATDAGTQPTEPSPEPGSNRTINVRAPWTPDVTDETLPAVPDTVELNEQNLTRAIGAWNKAMPEYRDLLIAEIDDDREEGDE